MTERPIQPVAFLFPGLGDPYLGMGRELYRTLPIFRACIDRCAALLQPELGVDIRDIIYPLGAFASEDAGLSGGGRDLRRMSRDHRASSIPEECRIHEARHAQPALFIVEYALAKQWLAWGLRLETMLGYSLGEYVAACLAGVLSLQDALSLVARRAQWIESLPPGAMLAVMLPEANVVAMLGPHLALSAVNGPEFCVVSGPPEAIARAERELGERRIATRRVHASYAYHSPMMAPIAPKVARLLEGYTLKPARIPYVSNVTGALITAAQATDPAYWSAHLCKPVRFAESLGALPSPVLLEVGPGQTLSRLARSSAPTMGARILLPSMRHDADPDSDMTVLGKAIAGLLTHGALPIGEDLFEAPPAAED
ncbi:acyltransferase domain-containing protein [Pendulispora albinea]|uniref:Acyltransferase domain-containing protein n=1 Tax=Pendulispora albinea TaxID=2741071 RepID=A0ABZ2MA02_9BACT